MRGIVRARLPACQRGAALLILLALVSVVLTYAVAAGLNRSATGTAQERAQKTAAALAQAKEALIAYAVTYADDPAHARRIPGFLPCPGMETDASKEGVAKSPCDSALVSQLGRLPWRTLDLGPVTDGSGECLWYAVSGTYKSWYNGVTTKPATSNMMNWDTNGQFAVKAGDGTTYLAGSAADNRAVAVIFAPGSVLSGQNRTPDTNAPLCAGNYTAANYLETAAGVNNGVVSATANAIDTFIAAAKNDTFNDQLVYITRADIWNAIKKRTDFNDNLRALTRRAAECVALYGMNNKSGGHNSLDLEDKRLPWARATSLSNYAVNSRYDDANKDRQGRLSYKVDDAKSSTKNSLPGSWLFTTTTYCAYTDAESDWYEHWKDHLFFALAKDHRPDVGRHDADPSCSTCLRVNGAGKYAAVLILAGEKLDGKSRTVAEKSQMSNYLEGRNLSNDPNNGGNSNYEARNPLSTTFNDVIYAIDTSLTIKCYSASSSTMVLAPVAPSSPPGPYAACL